MPRDYRDVFEMSVADVPVVSAIPEKTLSKYADMVVQAVEKYIKSQGKAGWTGRGILSFILKLLAPGQPIPLGITAKKAGKEKIPERKKKIRVNVTVAEMGHLDSVAINGGSNPLSGEITLIVMLPSRFVVDVKELPKVEKEKLRSTFLNVMRHELQHSQQFASYGFGKTLGTMLTRPLRMAGHQARELWRRRGILNLTGDAAVSYFRMHEEFSANVEEIAAMWKRLGGKKMKLYDLLHAAGDVFNNTTLRDALIRAYYDDTDYRSALTKELKKRGVKLA